MLPACSKPPPNPPASGPPSCLSTRNASIYPPAASPCCGICDGLMFASRPLGPFIPLAPACATRPTALLHWDRAEPHPHIYPTGRRAWLAAGAIPDLSLYATPLCTSPQLQAAGPRLFRSTQGRHPCFGSCCPALARCGKLTKSHSFVSCHSPLLSAPIPVS